MLNVENSQLDDQSDGQLGQFSRPGPICTTHRYVTIKSRERLYICVVAIGTIELTWFLGVN